MGQSMDLSFIQSLKNEILPFYIFFCVVGAGGP
jgi:hypothetical protein